MTRQSTLLATLAGIILLATLGGTRVSAAPVPSMPVTDYAGVLAVMLGSEDHYAAGGSSETILGAINAWDTTDACMVWEDMSGYCRLTTDITASFDPDADGRIHVDVMPCEDYPHYWSEEDGMHEPCGIPWEPSSASGGALAAGAALIALCEAYRKRRDYHFAPINVCADCVFMGEYGTVEGWTQEQEDEHERAMDEHLIGAETFSTGHGGRWVEAEECHTWTEDGFCQCEPHFSWSACDACGSGLGGDRFPAVAHYPLTKSTTADRRAFLAGIPEWLREALTAYLMCALWSSTVEMTAADARPFGLTAADAESTDVEEPCIGEFQADVLWHDPLWEASNATLADAIEHLAEMGEVEEDWRDWWTAEQFGHDAWLTRNGHGVGFWDRYHSDSIGGRIGEALSEASGTHGTAYVEHVAYDEYAIVDG